MATLTSKDIAAKFNCMVACTTYDYKIQLDRQTTLYSFMSQVKTHNLKMYISDEMIPVTEERKFYTTDNFIADVGGYLGLLLGASVLALFDFIVDLIKAVLRKFSKRPGTMGVLRA